MNLLHHRVAEIAHECIEALAAAGPRADLVTSFARPIPSLVICEMIGVPDDERPEFQRRAYNAFDHTLTQAELVNTFAPMWEYIAALVVRQRQDPDDTILGGLVRKHGTELSDEEITGITNLLLVAGHDTTASMLGLGTLLLLRNPHGLAAMRDESGTVDSVIEEMLRYLSVA